MSYQQAAAAVLLLLEISVVSTLGIAVYRLFLHPLRKISGPKHLAVSGIPYIVENNLLGIFAKKVLKHHEKYGDIVRTGPNSISVDGTIGWPEVYGHSRGGRPEFPKWKPFFELGDASYTSIFTANREDHRRERRIVAHAFSDAAIKGQEALIMQYIDKLFDHFRKHAEQRIPTDVVRWYNFTTFDIVGDLALGESFHCLDQSDYHPWVTMIFAGIRASSQMQALMKLPYLSWIVKLLISKKDMQKRLDNRQMSHDKVERRLALGPAPNDRKDFMTYILRHNDEKGMSHAEILGNSEGFLVAGSETTATTLSGCTYYLSTNPVALERLQQEVRTAFPTERDITMLSTAQLKYLHACIEETLRIYPAAVETPPRVSPGEYVNGQYIPKGTIVTIFQWATHHNPNNFVQPDSFIPERWLGPDHPHHDPQFNADKKAALQPFSFGPRNCVGKNLAYNEMKVILARLVWNFNFVLQPKSHGWPDEQRVFIVWEKGPLWVQLKQVERG